MAAPALRRAIIAMTRAIVMTPAIAATLVSAILSLLDDAGGLGSQCSFNSCGGRGRGGGGRNARKAEQCSRNGKSNNLQREFSLFSCTGV